MAAWTFHEFDPAQWANSDAVRGVSLAARGLLVDLLVLVHGRSPRGHLQHRSGSPVSAAELALQVDAGPAEIAQLLGELQSAGLVNRTDRGALFVPHCAAQEGRPVVRPANRSDRRRDTLERSIEALRSNPAPDLVDWLEWWNRLFAARLVHAGVNGSAPSKAVAKAWLRCRANGDRRNLLFAPGQRQRIEESIRQSARVRDGWFRLEVLLAGDNKHGESIAAKLLDGAYRMDVGGESTAAYRDEAMRRLKVARSIRNARGTGQRVDVPADIAFVIGELGGWEAYAMGLETVVTRSFVSHWIRYAKSKGLVLSGKTQKADVG